MNGNDKSQNDSNGEGKAPREFTKKEIKNANKRQKSGSGEKHDKHAPK